MPYDLIINKVEMTMKQEADCRAQLEQLSLEEKATLLTGANFWNTAKVPGVNEILLSDGPSGIRKQTEGGDALGLTGSVETIAFPCLALIASTFDKDLLRKYGEYLGQIAKSEKVNVLLGPGMNIKRSPLAGRNFEYFSQLNLRFNILKGLNLKVSVQAQNTSQQIIERMNVLHLLLISNRVLYMKSTSVLSNAL